MGGFGGPSTNFGPTRQRALTVLRRASSFDARGGAGAVCGLLTHAASTVTAADGPLDSPAAARGTRPRPGP